MIKLVAPASLTMALATFADALSAQDVRAATIVVAASDTPVRAGNPVAFDMQVPAGADAAITIQSAVNAVRGASGGFGGKIVLLEGTYNLNSLVTMTNPAAPTPTTPNYCNIIIEGHSTSTIVGSNLPKRPSGTRIIYGPSGGFSLTGHWVASQPANRMAGIAFRYLHMEPNIASNNGAAIKLTCTNDVTIEQCYFEKCHPAILNEGSWDMHALRCDFDECGVGATGGSTSAVVMTPGPLGPPSNYDSLASGISGCNFFDCTWAMKRGVAIFSQGLSGRQVNNNLQIIGCKFEGYADATSNVAAPSIVGHLSEARIIGSLFFSSVSTTGARGTQEGTHIFIAHDTGIPSARNTIANNHFLDYTDSAVSVSGSNHLISNNQFVFYENRHGLTARVQPHILVRNGSFDTTITDNMFGADTLASTQPNIGNETSAFRTQVVESSGASGFAYSQKNGTTNGATLSLSQSQLGSSSTHTGTSPEGLHANWWFFNAGTWVNRGFSVLGNGTPSFTTGTFTATPSSPPPPTLGGKSLKGWLQMNVNGSSYSVPLFQ